MGPIGVPEMVVIFIIALVLFGPKELPKLGKTVGKALTEFRRARDELKTTFDREMAQIERETASVREEVKKQVDEATGYDSYSDYGYYGNDASNDQYGQYSYSSEDGSGSTPYATGETANAEETVSASASSGADNPGAAVETAAPAPEAVKPPRGPAVVA
jgi:sec-independent protein translocase protein TatA